MKAEPEKSFHMRIIIALAVVTLMGAALPAKSANMHMELNVLLEWMVGYFDNDQQVRQQENFLREGPEDPERMPDRLYPVFAVVNAPEIGRHVVYLQWHMGSPQGPLQRQRIWVFEADDVGNAVMMDFFTLREPERWRDAHLQPASAVSQMTLEDVTPYPLPCRLPFRRHIDVFIGEIPREQCNIVSQQTRTAMTINARVIVGSNALWYDESGVRQDGRTAFRVPASGSYQFQRRSDFKKPVAE